MNRKSVIFFTQLFNDILFNAYNYWTFIIQIIYNLLKNEMTSKDHYNERK